MTDKTSLSLSAETRRQIEELLEAWGEPGLSNVVARAVQQAHDRMLVAVNTWRRLLKAGLYDDPFPAWLALPGGTKAKLVLKLNRK